MVIGLLCLGVLSVDAKPRRSKNRNQVDEPEASLSNFIFKIMKVDSLKMPPVETGPRLSTYGRSKYRRNAMN